MVIKINYTSSDIYVSTNVSPVYVVVNYSGTNGIGTVTSVGLSMPSAFNVANSPITTSGTIAVTGSGTTAQYVRGDGSLASFPSLTGYVPYTGATGAVNLGPYDLTVNELTIGKGLNGVANNTALGKRTLFHNTTGNYNTAVGHEAGHNITTGQYNTAIGQSAMFTATTAGQNTAIGVNALLLTTSGGSNVAVGLDTLQHITTGSSNTAIGYNAGSHITGGSTPNTTATNSVFIGRDSKAAADGQTNQIVIGQNAVGNGSNTATFGNTATTANYFTGSINGGSFVKSGGTSSQFLKADGSVDSSTYVGGSGATGQVAYWNGTNSQTGSNNLFWDAANARLGIGTNAPAYKLDVSTDSRINGDLYLALGGVLRFGTSLGVSKSTAQMSIYSGTSAGVAGGTIINYWNGSAYAGGLQLTNNANTILQAGGTFVDGGQRLQVYGDTLLRASGSTSATTGLQVENSTGINLLTINNSGFYRLSGSNGMFLSMFTTSGGTASISGSNTQFYNYTTTQAATSGAFLFTGDSFVQTSGAVHTIYINKGFIPTSGNASFSNLTITPNNINQTGGANGITRGLYVNPTLTSAADWRSIEWSNNSGWGLYGAGTANNYLGGALGIAVSPIARLDVAGSATDTETVGGVTVEQSTVFRPSTGLAGLRFGFNSANTYIWSSVGGGSLNLGTRNAGVNNVHFTLTAAGRLLLGTTTESTFLLDVNGTARVSGNLTVTGVIYTDAVATRSGVSIDFRDQAAASIMYLDATNKRVGIGTTSPAYKMHLLNSGSVTSAIEASGAGADSILRFISPAQYWTITNDGTSANLTFNRGGTDLIRFTPVGNLLVGTTTDVASSKVTIDSTTQGFLPPRMTTTQKNAISSPAAGLIVYDTTLNKLCVRTAAAWETITSL